MTTTAKQAALDRLHQGVTDLMTSHGWQAALKFRSQFHTYSFFNTLLILNQRPDAQLVSGYRKWQELGRQVRKGEKGITILAPMLRKDENDEDKRILIGFKEVKVFDISQTDGEPIPTTPKPVILEGDTSLITSAITSLEAFCVAQGITFDRCLDHPRALGVYRHSDNSISLKPGLPKLQELKTFVHELAHALLHNPSSDRTVAELEAESAAYLTLHQLGLDTSDYTFAYLASWANDLGGLIDAGHNASKADDRILAHLGPLLIALAGGERATTPEPPTPKRSPLFVSH